MFKIDMYVTVRMHRNSHEMSNEKVRVVGCTNTRQVAITMIATKLLDYIQDNSDLVEVTTKMDIGNHNCHKAMKLSGIDLADAISSFRGLAVDIAQTIGGELHRVPINSGGM